MAQNIFIEKKLRGNSESSVSRTNQSKEKSLIL